MPDFCEYIWNKIHGKEFSSISSDDLLPNYFSNVSFPIWSIYEDLNSNSDDNDDKEDNDDDDSDDNNKKANDDNFIRCSDSQS